jgi:hypothetical protein
MADCTNIDMLGDYQLELDKLIDEACSPSSEGDPVSSVTSLPI